MYVVLLREHYDQITHRSLIHRTSICWDLNIMCFGETTVLDLSLPMVTV